MIARVFGERARFCDEGCRDSFKCDREHHLIYPSYSVDGEIMGVGQASIEAWFCAYCGREIIDGRTKPRKDEVNGAATAAA